MDRSPVFRTIPPDSNERFKVVFVGGLSVRKGLHKLLRAANRLKGTDIVFRIVGSPSPDTRFLRSLANSPNIEWVGHLPWNRLADELASAHVMVLPSIEEGLAIVQGQALACGCPVIASSATGAADLFVDGEQGVILDDCTSEAIEAEIMRFYANRDLCRQMSVAAASLAARLGGWADYGEKLSNRLLELTKITARS